MVSLQSLIRLNLLVLVALAFLMKGCATKETSTDDAAASSKKMGLKSNWDYDRIREQRDAEKAQTPPDTPRSEMAEQNCTIMSGTEMRRSRRSGCQKLDARSGHAHDSFCCPAESQ